MEVFKENIDNDQYLHPPHHKMFLGLFSIYFWVKKGGCDIFLLVTFGMTFDLLHPLPLITQLPVKQLDVHAYTYL